MWSLCLLLFVIAHTCDANLIFGFRTASVNQSTFGASNDPIRVTLYWSSRMYQCHLIPRELDSVYYCNTSDFATTQCYLPEPGLNGLQIDHTQGTDGLFIDTVLAYKQLQGDQVESIAMVDSFCFHDAPDAIWRGEDIDTSCTDTADLRRYDIISIKQSYNPYLLFNFSDESNVYIRSSAAEICEQHGDITTYSPVSTAPNTDILQVKLTDPATKTTLDDSAEINDDIVVTNTTQPLDSHASDIHDGDMLPVGIYQIIIVCLAVTVFVSCVIVAVVVYQRKTKSNKARVEINVVENLSQNQRIEHNQMGIGEGDDVQQQRDRSMTESEDLYKIECVVTETTKGTTKGTTKEESV